MSWVGDDFWHPIPPSMGRCWVCGELTDIIYLDMGWQHRDCDAYPAEEGHVRVVRGVKEIIPYDEDWQIKRRKGDLGWELELKH